MKKIKVIIVDDHKLLREMYVEMFFRMKDIEVIGECDGFEVAIKEIKAKKPDIVLMDINLPPFSGMDAVSIIREFSPATRIIGVSMHNELFYAKKMIQLGCKGYITKNSAYVEILNAIDQIMNGGVYVCKEIKDILACQFVSDQQQGLELDNLTSQELKMIKLIKEGYTSKEIAAENNITVKTVEVHRYNIFKKLKINNTASLITLVNNTGLGLT